MVHALPYVAIALIAVVAAVVVFRVKDNDPDWAEHWRSLDPADRTRIANAVHSGALLADPEEIELGAGLARRDRSYGYGTTRGLWLVFALALGVALLIAGLVTDMAYLLVFSALVLLPTLWSIRGALHRNGNLREAISRGRGA